MSTADVGKPSSMLHLPQIDGGVGNHRLMRMRPSLRNNITSRSISRASSMSSLAILNGDDGDDHDDLNKITKHKQKQKQKPFVESSMSSFNIPEHVQAIYSSDPNKVSIPVFGSRPGTSCSVINNNVKSSPLKQNRPQSQQQQHQQSPKMPNVNIDEYLATFRDKIRTNPYEIRAKFRNVDVDHGSKGISREALAHIMASTLGPTKPLSHQNFLKLIDKLGLKDLPVIRYEDFVNSFKEKFDWDDTQVDRTNGTNASVIRKATQIYVILKEKAKMRTSDMVRLVPLLNGGIASKVFKHELSNTINAMGIKMEPEEYDKLWKKFDSDNIGFINAEIFLKKLGVSSGANSDDALNADKMSLPVPDFPEQIRNDYVDVAKKKSSAGLNTRNPIEKWLKRKFRDGFIKMKTSFEEIDIHKTGQVRRDQFLKVLRQYNLVLEDTLLDAFLERCGIKVVDHSTLISYKQFLEKCQSRNDRGLAYRFIQNGDLQEDRPMSKVGHLQKKVINAFQNDFLGLLQTFRRIDRTKSNTISKQEFRAALESHFGIELTNEEFDRFLKDVPIDNSSNKIQYLEFMTRFDSDTTSSLFDSQSIKDFEDFQPRFAKMPNYDTINEENENINDENSTYKGRSLEQLRKIIKDRVRNDYKSVEAAWDQVDTLNSNEMGKDIMYEMFKKLKFIPCITREEIELLWSEFILKDNKKLDYWQFVRHFGYSKKSASYQNAKVAPPKKGDNDLMLTSNKLGRDSILIRGSVQSKLITQFDNLKRNFEEIDPYKTQVLLREEFEEILLEFCPELNKQELDFICSKYDNQGRIKYMEFLSPYSPKKFNSEPSDHLNASENVQSSRIDNNDSLIIKLRTKLSEHYKELRRIFKQHDFKQTGFVTINAFKEVLATRIKLSDEDMYDLLRRLDKQVNGTINYNKFINEIIKP